MPLRVGWIVCAALVCAAGQASAQNGGPEPGRPGGQPAQTSAAEEPSGAAAQWLKVPEVKIIPGGANTRPNIENPKTNDPASVQRGMQYFIEFNCVGCHAPNGGGGMGPSLSEGIFKYGGEPANIYLTIAHGRPLGMPSWGGVLPAEAIWDLVSYVKSISKAPAPQWGQTVSPQSPGLEQVPAEFQQSATPWQFTQPFSKGQKPTEQLPTGQKP